MTWWESTKQERERESQRYIREDEERRSAMDEAAGRRLCEERRWEPPACPESSS